MNQYNPKPHVPNMYRSSTTCNEVSAAVNLPEYRSASGRAAANAWMRPVRPKRWVSRRMHHSRLLSSALSVLRVWAVPTAGG